MKFASDGATFAFLHFHQARRQLFEFRTGLLDLQESGARLTFQAEDLVHAEGGKQQAQSQRDQDGDSPAAPQIVRTGRPPAYRRCSVAVRSLRRSDQQYRASPCGAAVLHPAEMHSPRCDVARHPSAAPVPARASSPLIRAAESGRVAFRRRSASRSTYGGLPPYRGASSPGSLCAWRHFAVPAPECNRERKYRREKRRTESGCRRRLRFRKSRRIASLRLWISRSNCSASIARECHQRQQPSEAGHQQQSRVAGTGGRVLGSIIEGLSPPARGLCSC